jgi:hypothetical protein
MATNHHNILTKQLYFDIKTSNYLSHPASVETKEPYAQHHAPQIPLKESNQKKKKYQNGYHILEICNILVNQTTTNLPDPRICTRISTIFPIFSGVSLQKRGSPLIACTRTCKATEKKM